MGLAVPAGFAQFYPLILATEKDEFGQHNLGVEAFAELAHQALAAAGDRDCAPRG